MFACSLTNPLGRQLASLGQSKSRKLIADLDFNMPFSPRKEDETPPSTAIVKGLITASPRTVHRMSAIILASLTGRGHKPVAFPTLITHFDRSALGQLDDGEANSNETVLPNALIRASRAHILKAFLSSPLCYTHGGAKYGTLKSLSHWCAARAKSVRLHFAKTGTHVAQDADATVDVWVSGGIQFSSGKAYSYVVLVGTGNSNRPFARSLHAAQIAAPIANVLLKDLSQISGKKKTLELSLNRKDKAP